MTKYIQTLPETHWLTRWRRAIFHGDLPWKWIIIASSILVMILILAVGDMLWRESVNARTTFGFGFLTPTKDPNWDPVNDQFQAWPFIYGTLLTSFVALLIALPISVGIAIFMAELCPQWLRLPLNWLVELLAAIPSVVYGLWGIFVFLPLVVAPIASAEHPALARHLS
jgi:phosphate transport system permease protein